MFHFKHFSIQQDRCPMKVGTDGVLLGAWVEVHPAEGRVLDIGTGTGLLALMLAQRTTTTQLIGVDVEAVSQARENAAASPWAERLHFVQSPVQEYASEELFGLIVSNPPYFVDSLTCPDAGRTKARHAVSLSYEALRDAVVRLLAPEGRFAVVLPLVEGERFRTLCMGYLHLCRLTEVRTTPHRTPKRVLMEFSPVDASSAISPPTFDMLTIGTGIPEEYTSEYRHLTRDFYLKF